jgi:type 1 fimbriae regulatory protein FimB/type 1 fimbriae regulatory protein FimE
MISRLRLVARTTENRTVTPKRRKNAELRTREYLTDAEVESLQDAAKANRWGHRDDGAIAAVGSDEADRRADGLC